MDGKFQEIMLQCLSHITLRHEVGAEKESFLTTRWPSQCHKVLWSLRGKKNHYQYYQVLNPGTIILTFLERCVLQCSSGMLIVGGTIFFWLYLSPTLLENSNPAFTREAIHCTVVEAEIHNYPSAKNKWWWISQL